jgi:hypothetical protein
MNKVQKLLLDIKMAEAKLEYCISRGDDEDTPVHIAGWSYYGNLMIYSPPRELTPEQARSFAEWVLSMLEDGYETLG